MVVVACVRLHPVGSSRKVQYRHKNELPWLDRGVFHEGDDWGSNRSHARSFNKL